MGPFRIDQSSLVQELLLKGYLPSDLKRKPDGSSLIRMKNQETGDEVELIRDNLAPQYTLSDLINQAQEYIRFMED